MKHRALLIALTLFTCTHHIFAQGSAFTYQGRLNDAGAPANGSYDLRFTLYDALAGGSSVLSVITNTAAPVSNGLFTVTLDFGAAAFDGAPRWLEVAVRTNGAGSFAPLVPRQAITAAPYAIYAARVPASGIQGSLSNTQLPSSVITNGASAVALAGTFTGNGAALSNVNASSLSGMGASGFWQLGGNNVASGQFLGTTNAQPLQLRAGGVRAAQYDRGVQDWGSVNVLAGSPANFIGGALGGVTIAGGGATNYLGVTQPWQNTASGNFATVSGGAGNDVVGLFGTVGGGRENAARVDYATVAGGVQNYASGTAAFIGGGGNNTNSATYGTIGGGSRNLATGQQSTIGGGIDNTASGFDSTVAGGSGNRASGTGSTIGGGGYDGAPAGNEASGVASTIAGGAGNKANDRAAVVGGGIANIGGYYAVVGGGSLNVSTNGFSTIGGGTRNLAIAAYTTIGGGYANTNTGIEATIGGGYNNVATAEAGTIGGGLLNQNSGARATISGGAINNAVGQYATIPGGYNNVAAGNHSFAAGQSAQAMHPGAFVWADTQPSAFTSTITNSFIVRAAGGVGINTNAPQAPLHVAGAARVTGLLRLGSEQGASNTFNLAGLVVRRVESINQAVGQIVARTDDMTLERDGTTSGLLMRFTPFNGRRIINAIGMNNSGALVTSRTVLPASATPGVVYVFTSAQRIVHAQISFGDAYFNAHMTQLVLDRTDDGSTDDNYWVGTMTSSYNQ